ncbi:MAG TPA: hypothetical protein VHP14_04415 [Anaerolineales bacterium]|nr:hypothetical protein [Anaerolineales bacterium]
MNDTNPSVPFWKRRIPPALALWLIAPVFGELVSGSTPLNEYISPFTILLCMLYGSGAVIIRERLIRGGKSWRGLLWLGAAYGIFEEGLMVRSFFDPNWQDLEQLGIYGRAIGVNWVWTEHLIIFHMLISVAASIVFVEILYPDQRATPWIGTRGTKWNLIFLAITLPVGALMNPYNTPDIWLGVCWFAIVLMALAAWHAGQAPATAKEAQGVRVPPPWLFWWIAFLGMVGQTAIIYVPAERNNLPFLVTMLLVALFDLLILWVVLRWSGNAQSWDDRHRLALINGGLSFWLVLGPLVSQGQYPIMYFSNPILLVLLWWVAYKVNQRVKAEGRTAAQSLP